jgi:cold shock CspA family protein
MLKAMIFIDGTWLYCNTSRLGAAHGKADFHLDFGKLPNVLAEELSRQTGQPLDIVRTHLFGSYAANCDPRDDEARQRRLDFFARLKEDYHYEIEVYPINFMGRRLKKSDRDPGDAFEPREKCVDISLASSVLYNAAIPNSYDIAVVVVGDQDFKPVLQNVRRLGRRVALASIRSSCAPDFADPRDEARVKDFDTIWLDDLLERIELRYNPHKLVCESPMHKGEREVWTTFHPRRGQQFFCETCRNEFVRMRHDQRESMPATGFEGITVGMPERGQVIKKVAERGFGFIQASDGRDYFFHLADLVDGLGFDEIVEGMSLSFEIKREPTKEKGGTAQNVRRLQQDRPLEMEQPT